jgi:penicillin-binding protein 1C
MKNKIIFFWLLIVSTLFLTYSFLPLITYDNNYSQHVNSSAEEAKGPGRVFLEDKNGEVITDKMYPGGYYKFVETSVESEFVKALIEIEDKNYYEHNGVNVVSKLRALWDNVSGKRVSGGSTITEQYVKNKYFVNHKRSYLQKAREAMIAVYISIWSPSSGEMSEGQRGLSQKDQLLTLYLHDAYFGNQLYGVGSALEVYFEKESLSELTQEEIVILLTLLHNPWAESTEETYFRKYFEQTKKRLGYDFERTYTGKLKQKQNIDRFPFVTQRFISEKHTPPVTFVTSPSTKGNKKSSLVEGGSWANVNSEGVSSIDAELQEFTRETIQIALNELAEKNVTNAAVYALVPSTGEVLIYQGSKDFWAKDIEGQVDVIQARRQPGSTMKPFLYLQALENWAYPDDLVLDIESQYNSFQEGKVYISENYSLKEYGLVRLKKALGNSFNNATVRLAREIGLEEVYDFYTSYGFQFNFDAEHYGYSLVLGNSEVSLESLVESYRKLLPNAPPVTSVASPSTKGDKKSSLNKGGDWVNAKSEGAAVAKFLLYDILSDPDNRDISFGVNSLLSTSIPQAVKTGTSSDFRDNWVVSYHPDLIVGVWVGNNDNSSMQWVTGISGAWYIWYQVIEKAIEQGYIQNRDRVVPAWVIEADYCLDSLCFRKENIYSSEWKEYYSRLLEGIYASDDIYENLDNYEREKLYELGIRIY